MTQRSLISSVISSKGKLSANCISKTSCTRPASPKQSMLRIMGHYFRFQRREERSRAPSRTGFGKLISISTGHLLLHSQFEMLLVNVIYTFPGRVIEARTILWMTSEFNALSNSATSWHSICWSDTSQRISQNNLRLFEHWFLVVDCDPTS
jgi:hypothetical protein